jgi:hypothetical protein
MAERECGGAVANLKLYSTFEDIRNEFSEADVNA